MTIFAVICALMFPGIHVGRIWFEYWIAPLPNQMNMWPNFRSPLLWDFFAVGTYFTVSLCFWYMGMIPDIATLRDRAKGKVRQIAYGVAALGWNGSNRHWHRYERAYCCWRGWRHRSCCRSTRSSASISPRRCSRDGTRRSSRRTSSRGPSSAVRDGPPAGGSLPRMVRVEGRHHAAASREHVQDLLATGMMVGYAYAIEFFISWYSGNPAEGFVFVNRAFGPYAWAYWTMVFCNVVTPQAFWSRRARSNPWIIFGVAACVNVGMWFERFVIIVTSLSRDFLPSSWGTYSPTIVEILILAEASGCSSPCSFCSCDSCRWWPWPR
jgi:molybdopterin-containing oxidoreductase family membrane subunit